MPERVAIFIDGKNLEDSLKLQGLDPNLDYSKFLKKLCGDRILVRAYFYTAQLSPTVNKTTYEEQEKFFSRLDNVPYLSMRLGYLQRQKLKKKIKVAGIVQEVEIDTFREKGVDTRLVIDLLDMAHKDQYDTAILVSRDNDFKMLIEIVQGLGKHVEVAFTTIAYHLHRSADLSVILNKAFIEDCYPI